MALPRRLSNQVVRRKKGGASRVVTSARSSAGRAPKKRRGGGFRLKLGLSAPRFPRVSRSAVLGFLKMAAVVAVLAVIGVAVVNGYTKVQASGEFSLQTIEVRGLSHLKAQEILSVTGLKKGDNILNISLEEVRRRALTLPRVKEAKIIRQLPATIVVEIQERVPAALIQWNGEMKLIDRDGVSFSVLPDREQWQLPIVTGVVYDGTPEGRPIQQAGLKNAMEVLSLLDSASLALISEVYAEKDGSVTLFTTGRSTKVLLGQGDFGTKVGRLNHAQSLFASRGEVKDVIDLRFNDLITRP